MEVVVGIGIVHERWRERGKIYINLPKNTTRRATSGGDCFGQSTNFTVCDSIAKYSACDVILVFQTTTLPWRMRNQIDDHYICLSISHRSLSKCQVENAIEADRQGSIGNDAEVEAEVETGKEIAVETEAITATAATEQVVHSIAFPINVEMIAWKQRKRRLLELPSSRHGNSSNSNNSSNNNRHCNNLLLILTRRQRCAELKKQQSRLHPKLHPVNNLKKNK